MRPKVSVIGAGHVGECTAMYLAEKNICDITIIDIVEDMPMGKGLDLSQAGPVHCYESKITGSNDFADLKDSDIVVHTAGLPRKPGMSREDLINSNAKIIGSVSENIKKYAPNAIVIMVANPLDIMTYHCWKITGFDNSKVFGQAGVLDSIRFRTFVAMELGVSVSDIHAMVLGGHGDTMVPLPRYTTVSGVPLTELMDQPKIDAIVDRTRKGGIEIVNFLKTGSAYYAPSAAAVEMVESIIMDQKRMLPCSALLQGEFGLDGIYMGVPCLLGKAGLEKIVEIEVSKDERDALNNSAQAVKQTLDRLAL